MLSDIKEKEKSIEFFAKNYGEFFENISLDNIYKLNQLCIKDIIFKDPFNEFSGVEKFQGVFRKMFDDVTNPKFSVIDISTSDSTAYMKWTFTFGRKPIKIEGTSEIIFNADGLVVSHTDYWNSPLKILMKILQIVNKIPMIKYLINFIIKKISK